MLCILYTMCTIYVCVYIHIFSIVFYENPCITYLSDFWLRYPCVCMCMKRLPALSLESTSFMATQSWSMHMLSLWPWKGLTSTGCDVFHAPGWGGGSTHWVWTQSNRWAAGGGIHDIRFPPWVGTKVLKEIKTTEDPCSRLKESCLPSPIWRTPIITHQWCDFLPLE